MLAGNQIFRALLKNAKNGKIVQQRMASSSNAGGSNKIKYFIGAGLLAASGYVGIKLSVPEGCWDTNKNSPRRKEKCDRNNRKMSNLPEIKSLESLVKKHVTEEVYNKYKDHKTKTCGFTLDKAIACAVQFDDQHVGIYAGDADSYEDFTDVFKPIILDYHGLKGGFAHQSDLNPEKLVGTINPAAPVKSTRVRVGRNIEGFGLSPGITKDQRLGVENLMKNAFPKLAGVYSCFYAAFS